MTAAHRTGSPAWTVPWVVAEAFAGVGSVARGFARAGGFQVAYLNDIDPVARATYLANDPPETVYELRDIRTVTGPIIREAADGRPVAGLLGCPPCQGWSAAGQRDAADRRNRLLKDFFRLVNSVYPVFFVMENVPSVADRAEFAAALEHVAGQIPGLAWSSQRSVLRVAAVAAAGAGDRLPARHRGDPGLPAADARRPPQDLGLPHRAVCGPVPRHAGRPPGCRAAAGGARAAQYSMRDHYPQEFASLAQFVTVGEAIGDLEDSDADGPRSRYARALGAGRHELANHEPWDHGKDLVDRMRRVREGCRPPIEATNGRRYYSQAYARLHRRGLARTITTNFHNPGSGRFLHYRLHRTLTVREAARLQGFGDDFVFIGHPGWQERLVGNAFPPLWAETIASHVAAELHDVLAA